MSTNRKSKILFICHEASLTGAPILLLNLAELIKKKGDFEISFLLLRGGVIEQRFYELGPTRILKERNYQRSRVYLVKLLDFLIFKSRFLLFKLFAGRPDFIFVNSLGSSKLMCSLRRWKVPYYFYVHELDSVIKDLFADDDIKKAIAGSERIFVPSPFMERYLQKKFDIDRSLIRILPYWIRIENEVNALPNRINARKELAAKYGLDPNKKWIVGMGTVTYRKGVDIFLDTADELLKSDKNLAFVWIGPLPDDDFCKAVKNRVGKLPENQVVLTGPVPNGLRILDPFDIFLLTSREDPYPLVVLEASLKKIPVFCFENSGGIVDFIADECGILVRDMNGMAMASALRNNLTNPEQLQQIAENANKRVHAWHGSREKIYSIVQEELTAKHKIK